MVDDADDPRGPAGKASGIGIELEIHAAGDIENLLPGFRFYQLASVESSGYRGMAYAGHASYIFDRNVFFRMAQRSSPIITHVKYISIQIHII